MLNFLGFRLQEARLALLKDQLRRRHEAQENATFQRINQMYAEYEEEKETRLQKIHNDYLRCTISLDADFCDTFFKRLYVNTLIIMCWISSQSSEEAGG